MKIHVGGGLLGLSLLWLVATSLASAARPTSDADTSTIILTPVADSFVVSNSGSNFGSAGELRVDYVPTGDYRRGLVQFSLVDLAYQFPEGAVVQTATLQLYLREALSPTQILTITTGSGAEWAENTVNWGNQPAWVGPVVAHTVTPAPGHKTWDVTPLVQGWLHGSLPNRGLGVLGPESGPDVYGFTFDSRTGQFPPELIIEYELPPPTPPPPTEIPLPPHPANMTDPVLILSSDTAAAGGQVRVTGFDFPDDLCARYDTFLIDNSLGPVLMGSQAPQDGGLVTMVMDIPAQAGGQYSVVTIGGGHQASTHLVITPTTAAVVAGPIAPAVALTATLQANPSSGAPGSLVTVSGSGFAGSGGCDPVNFYWQQVLSSGSIYFTSVGTGYLSGGNVSYQFAVPSISNGSAFLWAVGPSDAAITSFEVCCQSPPPPPGPNPVTVSMCASTAADVSTNAPNPTDDGMLSVGYAYNAVQQLDIDRLALVRFDLSAIPIGATVTQASLQLTLQGSSGLSQPQVGVYELSAPWSPGSITWAQLQDQSPYATREMSRQSVGTAPGAYTWDVTAAAQDWVDSPATNMGLSVEDAGRLYQAYNRNFAQSGANCPRLTVTYDPSTAGPDLYVGGVDLIQTVGSLSPYRLPYARTTATINLAASPIAGKSTLLRVFAGTSVQLSQVMGTVTGYPCGSSAALAGSPLAPADGAIVALPYPSASQRGDGLNFVLPSSWLTGCLDLAMTLTSMAELETAARLANNTARWNGINFRATQTLNLVLIPLYSIDLGQYASAQPQYVGGILNWLNAVFPLADGDIRYWYTPLQYYDQVIPDDGSDLLDDLEDVRDSIRGVPANTRYIGLVPSAATRPGMARRGGSTSPTAGNVAYVSNIPVGSPIRPSDASFYGPTWAQEIAHLFGRMHASNAHGEAAGGAVDCQYPSYRAYFNHGGIGSYGVAFNTEWWTATSTAAPPNDFILPGTVTTHTHDFMSYGSQPNWVSPYTFNALARAFNYQAPQTGIDCDDLLVRAASAVSLPAAPAAPVDVIRLAGHINDDHGVEWRPAYHSVQEGPALGADGEYRLEVRDDAGAVLVTHFFDGEHTAHDDGSPVSFSERLPWPAGAARVVLKRHDFVLSDRLASANAPTVQVLSPNGGESVGASLTVSWLGSDADGGLLTYAVVYNTGPDDAWWPIAVGLTSTAGSPMSYTVSTDLLPGSDQARVRVLVSDGLRSADDESDAGFSVPEKSPVVTILYPAEGAELPPGGSHNLVAAGYDAEDGSLSGASLVWTSDRDGVLGQGSHLRHALSAGAHQLTLTATDSDGGTTMVELNVIVHYHLYLPLVAR